jgi:hypothetical protein
MSAGPDRLAQVDTPTRLTGRITDPALVNTSGRTVRADMTQATRPMGVPGDHLSTATPGTATPGTATPGTAIPGTAIPGTATRGTAIPGMGDLVSSSPRSMVLAPARPQ